VASISLVAFDLDDTLYSERAFVRSGFRVVSDYLVRAGIADRPLFDDFEVAFQNGVRGNTFNRVLAESGIEPTEELVQRLVAIYQSHRSPYGVVRPDIRLYDDADRALADLKARGLRVVLISDGDLLAQETKVRALGLARRMDAIVLTGAWEKRFSKPHPRAFREVAERFSLSPQACVYVADNPTKDFQGPSEALWRPSIWVRRPDGIYRDAVLADGRLVSATAADLTGLAATLEGLFGPP